MTSVRRALAISFVERYALIALSLASNILIARLLSPEEIGLYSVSLAVIGIAQVLRDFGVGGYLIQEKNLTQEHIRTAFGVSLLMGGMLFLLAFFGASLAGRIYGELRMVETLRICAFNFLILPFCTVSLALLRREMQFQKVLYVTLTATAIGFVITIALAYSGYGANSMAFGTLVTNLVTGSCAWLARGAKTIMLPSLTQWRIVASFGAQRSAASIACTTSNDMIELVTGKILGFASVAMLSRAQGLMNLFQRDLMSAISNVAYPAFARSYREGNDVELQHINSIGAITVVAWPFYSFLALFPLEMLRLLFGTQWDAAAHLVPWYCLAGAVFTPCYLIIPVLTSIGRIDVAMKIELVVQPLRAVFIILGLIVLPHINTLPILYTIAAVCAAPYYYLMKEKVLPTRTIQFWQILARSGIVTAISLSAPLILSIYLRQNGAIEFWGLVTAAMSCFALWILGLFLANHPLYHDPVFLGAVRRMKAFLRFGI